MWGARANRSPDLIAELQVKVKGDTRKEKDTSSSSQEHVVSTTPFHFGDFITFGISSPRFHRLARSSSTANKMQRGRTQEEVERR